MRARRVGGLDEAQWTARQEHSTGSTGTEEEDRFHLARDDLIQATGSVDKNLGGGRYKITLENGQQVTAGLSPYDPSHGFITFRLKEGPTGPGR